MPTSEINQVNAEGNPEGYWEFYYGNEQQLFKWQRRRLLEILFRWPINT